MNNKFKDLQLQHEALKGKCQLLQKTTNTLNIEIALLESKVSYLEMERDKTKSDHRDFIDKFEQNMQSLHEELAAKECELQQLRTKTTTTNTTMDIWQVQLLEMKQTNKEIFEENEILRNSAHDMLISLRAYSDTSNYIIFDERLKMRILNTLKLSVMPATSPEKKLNIKMKELKQFPNESEANQKVHAMPMSTQKLCDSLKKEEDIHVDIVPDTHKIYPSTSSAKLNETSYVLPEIETMPTIDNTFQEDVTIENKVNCSSDQFKEGLALIELKIKGKQRSNKFLRKELDNALTLNREKELQHILSVANLKKQLDQERLSNRKLEVEFWIYQQKYYHDEAEYQDLYKSKQTLQARLAKLVDKFLAGENSSEQEPLIQEQCITYGIIEDDLQLKLLTVDEYNKQNADYQQAIDKYNQLSHQVSELKGLLQIAQDQIKSQQNFINQLTDNHVNLRYLVADLQSTTEDKFLLANIQRELDYTKLKVTRIEEEHQELLNKCKILENELRTAEGKDKYIQMDCRNKNLKIKFLGKSLHILKEKYAKFTPLVCLENFVYAYTKLIKTKCTQAKDSSLNLEHIEEIIDSYLEKELTLGKKTACFTKCIHLETHSKLLEENILYLNQKCENLEVELHELKIRHAMEAEHWKTVDALFIRVTAVVTKENDILCHVNTNIIPEANSKSTHEQVTASLTEIHDDADLTRYCATQTNIDHENVQQEFTKIPAHEIKDIITHNLVIEVKNQAVQTLSPPAKIEQMRTSDLQTQLQNMRAVVDEKQAILTKKEQDLLASRQRIDDLEHELYVIKSEEKFTTEDKKTETNVDIIKNKSEIFKKTSTSFHTLLSEKDLTFIKYQELMHKERENREITRVKLETEIESLKSTITDLNFNIKAKDLEILELNSKLQSLKCGFHDKQDPTDVMPVDVHINEITDEKLEEMFQQDKISIVANKNAPITIEPVSVDETEMIEKENNETVKELAVILQQMKEREDKIIYFQRTCQIKDEELNLLREKLYFYQEREKRGEYLKSPEMEQLRVTIEEKDRRINDLINTLLSFHDDQERFLKNANNHSADQLNSLASDLKRYEATNQIYQTQLHVMRRQMSSLTLREKQTREVNTTLRNELIKVPVFSINTQLNMRAKNENLQKRTQQLERELQECRTKLQSQQSLIDAKVAKYANELNLWEKQKRWQSNAEKLKGKLDETETTLEKTRALLQLARNNIASLEKDKHLLEAKLNKTVGKNAVGNVGRKCCGTPSSSNVQNAGAKNTQSVEPKTGTVVTSLSSSAIA